MKKVTAVVIGAGSRGKNYAAYALDFPDQFQVVGVVEPRKFYRERLAQNCNIPENACFSDMETFFKQPKMADCVMICTPDRLHKVPAVACAKIGYHILLEKPMAVTLEDCEEIVATCKDNNVMLAVCHVLRYTPQAIKIKELIESGVIGDVVNIQLLEPVGFWHFAHSFVRGNWHNAESSSFSLLAKSCHDIDLLTAWMTKSKVTRVSSFGSLQHFKKQNQVGYFHFAHSYVRGNWHNEATSSFSLLAKSCHDLDLINYWMKGTACKRVSSFGSLKHFKKDNQPAGASSRCLDCAVEASCPYSAKKIYLDQIKMGSVGWPVGVITEVPDIESVTEALRSGPYGKCVYDTDNDVMDNQVVNLQFEDGATASFTMVAFTEKVCARQVHIFGSKGELSCDFDRMVITEFNFLSQDRVVHDVRERAMVGTKSRLAGHGGADFHAMESFVTAIATSNPSLILTGPDETLYSHKLCFLAEKARRENTVINM